MTGLSHLPSGHPSVPVSVFSLMSGGKYNCLHLWCVQIVSQGDTDQAQRLLFFLTAPKVRTPESYPGEPKERQEPCSPHPPVHILFSSLKTPSFPSWPLPTTHRLGAAQQQCWDDDEGCGCPLPRCGRAGKGHSVLTEDWELVSERFLGHKCLGDVQSCPLAPRLLYPLSIDDIGVKGIVLGNTVKVTLGNFVVCLPHPVWYLWKRLDHTDCFPI